MESATAATRRDKRSIAVEHTPTASKLDQTVVAQLDTNSSRSTLLGLSASGTRQPQNPFVEAFQRLQRAMRDHGWTENWVSTNATKLTIAASVVRVTSVDNTTKYGGEVDKVAHLGWMPP
jgi:hypothetical protein